MIKYVTVNVPMSREASDLNPTYTTLINGQKSGTKIHSSEKK